MEEFTQIQGSVTELVLLGNCLVPQSHFWAWIFAALSVGEILLNFTVPGQWSPYVIQLQLILLQLVMFWFCLIGIFFRSLS